MSTDFWLGIVVGAIGMTVVLSFLLPDTWSIWIVLRKNFPIWGQIFLGCILVYSLTHVFVLAVEAMVDTQVPMWVWYLLMSSGGFFLTKGLYQLLKNKSGGAKC
ncbi:MAG: hypothetical protein Q8M92_02495 [Candidatus Subteraquimicrobiales bacterium]|nr:hypothetical protein [Candidatus Subteraquimicrobiales bacterium]